LARQAKNAAGLGNLKALYLTTKKLEGKFHQTDKPVKGKEHSRMLKMQGRTTHQQVSYRDCLHHPTLPLQQDLVEGRSIPAHWKGGLVKKRDFRDCSKYRGMSVPGKAFNRVLLERMKEAYSGYVET
jgi:hypothetical protein